jgi:hypothetical protein
LLSARKLGLYELNVESDGDFITNENAARLEGSVPGQSEVLSVDLCARRDRNPRVAPWVLGRWSWPFHREADLMGDAVYAQVAFDGQLSVPDDTEAFGLEVQGRELFHIKEIGARTRDLCRAVAASTPLSRGEQLLECGENLVPTERWGDRSQNCLHDVRIVGNTELIWDG